MIVAQEISKSYGKTSVLEALSFTVARGQSLALWGANGAGKTTLIRCLLAVHPFEGRLSIDGVDVQRDGKRARSRIGYVPQEIAFFDMTVQETMEFYAKLKKTKHENIVIALDKVQLLEQHNKAVNALSGGMKQRIALALALLAEPEILLLDEPTASLDAAAQREFIQIIRQLHQAGKTIVFSTHRFEELAALADKALVLESGKLKDLCSPQELAEKLGLRQWLRLVVAEQHRQEAINALNQQAYQLVPNGRAIYVNIQRASKLSILRLMDVEKIPVIDFDLADSHALPKEGASS